MSYYVEEYFSPPDISHRESLGSCALVDCLKLVHHVPYVTHTSQSRQSVLSLSERVK